MLSESISHELLDPHVPSSANLFPSQAFSQQERNRTGTARKPLQLCKDWCSVDSTEIRLSETNDTQKVDGKGGKKPYFRRPRPCWKNYVFNKKEVSAKGSRISLTITHSQYTTLLKETSRFSVLFRTDCKLKTLYTLGLFSETKYLTKFQHYIQKTTQFCSLCTWAVNPGWCSHAAH